MNDLLFAEDGTASASASVLLYALRYSGVVRFAVDSKSGSAIKHEFIRHRYTREEALKDAGAYARSLVQMWREDRVHIDDFGDLDDWLAARASPTARRSDAPARRCGLRLRHGHDRLSWLR